MYTTILGILKTPIRFSMQPRALLVRLIYAVLIVTPGLAQAAAVSLSVSENNGLVSVSANATFYNGQPGAVGIYLGTRIVAYGTGDGSASCSGVIDGAILTNGVHTVRGVGSDSTGNDEETSTFTIQNPVSLSASTTSQPTGPLDVTGNAQFLTREDAASYAGSIRIYHKAAASTSWPTTASRVKSYTTPYVVFSCADMDKGLYDVATWANGDYELRVEAIPPNNGHMERIVTTSIQNPIALSAQIDSHPKGPLNVTASAKFMERSIADATTGTIRLYIKLSGASSWSSSAIRSQYFTTPDVTFSCEDTSGGLIDVASMANGDYDFKVDAAGINSGKLTEIKPVTIDNTPKVTASCPRYVTGNFDITGSAIFTEIRDAGVWKGIVYARIDIQSTSYAKYKVYYKGDSSDFSYSEMAGAPLNAEALGYGEHVVYIRALSWNGTWSEWLEVPFRTGPPAEDGSGNTVIVPQQ